MNTWYIASLTVSRPPFSQGESVAVRAAGPGFDICTLSGANLTTLTLDEAKAVLRSAVGSDGFKRRVDAPGVLEMRLQRAGQPRDTAELMHQVVTGGQRPALGLGRLTKPRGIVGWRCFVVGCDKEIRAACGQVFTWNDQPAACPKCGSTLFIALYQ